ncbi:MAG: nicotinate-nucleotide diphosphorylase (carboxylating), partial [Pseudomonadota bacterium]|nr:nicotinate-nucleotide diphosphorylase (carboxylating) [Pseudomonadota bacterium]
MNTELSRESLLAAAQVNARAALAEDVGSGDISANLIPSARTAVAHIITRTPGVFCGQLWVDAVVEQVDALIEVTWHVNDGDAVVADQQLFSLAGPAASLLTAERSAL